MSTLREQLRELIREVLIETIQERDDNIKDARRFRGPRRNSSSRGKVKDPRTDKRLKRNRGDDTV